MYSAWGGYIGLCKRRSDIWVFANTEDKEETPQSTAYSNSNSSKQSPTKSPLEIKIDYPTIPLIAIPSLIVDSQILFTPPITISRMSAFSKGQVHQLKELFRTLFVEDCLDLNVYFDLNPRQRLITDKILKKRFKDSLFEELKQSQSRCHLDCHQHLQKKRIDHSEKSCATIIMNIIKERYQETFGFASSRTRDATALELFKRYFPDWFNPHELVALTQPDGGSFIDDSNVPKIPRMDAVFCIKIGLTAQWFRTISTRLLIDFTAVDLEEVRSYYVHRRLSTKLDEIFGKCGIIHPDQEEKYYSELSGKVDNKKFKLPMSVKELANSVGLVRTRVRNQSNITELTEQEHFQSHYGNERFLKEYNDWVFAPQTPLVKVTFSED